MAFMPHSIVIYTENPRSHLRYVQESGDSKGLLRIDPNTPLNSPYVKMEMELAETGEGLVHLRCAYCNKYWRRSSETDWWIAAEAKEPEDDQSAWSSTLFKPEVVGNNESDGSDGIQFRHMQTGCYVGLWSGESPYTNCLYVGPETTKISIFKYLDYGSFVFLPKYVAFKQIGENGKYVKAVKNLLQFGSDDFAEHAASQEISTTMTGNIIIKCDGFQAQEKYKFWTVVPSRKTMIFPDKGYPFRPFVAEKGNNPKRLYLALGCCDQPEIENSYNFCRQRTDDRSVGAPYLIPDLPSITSQTKLEVIERVLSREIYNVQYRLADARIFNEQITKSVGQEIKNDGTEPAQGELTFTYTRTQSKKFDNSASASAKVETSVQAGIPFFTDMTVSVSVEGSYSYSWGEEESTSQEESTQFICVAPPKTTLTVRLAITKGSMEVPFSYTQRDLLTSGHYATMVKHDGVYKGVDTTNYHFETKQVPPPKSNN